MATSKRDVEQEKGGGSVENDMSNCIKCSSLEEYGNI